MTQESYRSARSVFWGMDNGSAHWGAEADPRLQARWPTLQPVHTPLHASWLNQIEMSIVQRKVLTPNDFATLAALEHCLLAFQHRYQTMAQPFQWTFTRAEMCGLPFSQAVAIGDIERKNFDDVMSASFPIGKSKPLLARQALELRLRLQQQ